MSSFWIRAVQRLSGFTGSTLLLGITSVLVIPVVVTQAGTDAWEALAVGQATGAFAGILVGFGWVITGPATVAALPAARAQDAFAESLVLRGLVFLLVGPVAALVAIALAPAFPAAAAVSALTTTVVACGAAWYFIGRGVPSSLFLYDSLPRALCTLLGLVLLLAGLPFAFLVVAQFLGSIVGVVLSSWVILRSAARVRVGETLRRSAGVVSRQSAGLTTALASSVFISVPTLLVAAFVPAGIAVFALADRIQKLANMALMPVGQSIQGWVPAAPPLHVRAKRGTAAAIAIGFLCGSVLAIATPLIAQVLGQGAIEVGPSLAVPFGIALWFSMTSQVTGIACLVALGRTRDLTISALLGAAMCMVALAVLLPSFGIVGAAWAVAIGEGGLVLYQMIVLTRIRWGQSRDA